MINNLSKYKNELFKLFIKLEILDNDCKFLVLVNY